MTVAERQRRAREAAQVEAERVWSSFKALRSALDEICDRTSERMQTKDAMKEAIDAIGQIAASAVANHPL